MIRPFLRVVMAAVAVSAVAGMAGAQGPTHPLEGLKSQEYWAVYDVLRDSGKVDGETVIPSVLLHAPAKERVLVWKPGDPVFREADVLLVRKGLTIEARVDISARKLLSWKERPDVQAPMWEAEFQEVGEAILKDPRVVEALARRGIKDLTTVKCVALPYGYFATEELEGHRMMFGGCEDMHGAYSSEGHPIEGLYVQIDAVEKKVRKVLDEEVAPVPAGGTEFEESPERARPGTTPLEVRQPTGPSFQVSNGEVSWQNWHFRFRLDTRLGPIVNLVRFDDGTRDRSVMYEGSVSELFVPYMDPAAGWATRVFMDAGESFSGGILTPLREGVDCPENARYFDAIFPNEHGIPAIYAKEACLFELSPGEPSWRHQRKGDVWGRPSRVLVLRSAMVIGNYDYLIDWRFERDGSIRVAVGATGIILTRAVKETAATGTDGEMHGRDEYGTLVAKNTVGVNHDHFFSFRLDLDVDGQNNSFQADRLVRRELSNNPARKSIWAMQMSTARTEKEAMMDIHLDRPVMWRFVNPNVKGPLGHATGYELMPGVTAASLLDPEDGPQKVAAFSSHQLWVTPYRQDELYAAGVFPTASKGNDGLAIWTKADRPIENTDIVAWYTLGFHHVPRAEDFPVMPVMWHDFVIRPFNFFPQNPVLDLPMKP